jgi:hypothetical protein
MPPHPASAASGASLPNQPFHSGVGSIGVMSLALVFAHAESTSNSVL